MSWKTLHTKVLLNHPRIVVAEDEIELPDGHLSKYVYFKDHPDAAMVIATKGDEILIQKEYSYPPNRYLYQLPGGALELGEDPVSGALRELSEESGYTASVDSTITNLGYFYINNRRSDAKMHIVHITDPLATTATKPDPEEYITSEWITIHKLRKMIANGEIVNYSLLAGMSLYDNR